MEKGSARRYWAELEARARTEGGLTLYLGSDDDYGGTTLFGRDLWPDVLHHATDVRATDRGHALTFYRRRGYEIVGLLPDVNGAGRPDILLAKRLSLHDRPSA
jgi:aminoglycoside 6'-N-acetyltransferase I